MNEIAVKETFDFLYMNERYLTASQDSFVRGCKTQYQRNKSLSEKQLSVLNEIRKYLNVDEPIRYSNKL
jgi:hypothetical protein